MPTLAPFAVPSALPLGAQAPRATSLSSWVGALKRTLDLQGIDGAGLMAQAGLDLKMLADPLARYPSERNLAFWHLALQATQDPLLGIKVARCIGPSTFHALGYAAMASANLQDLFERLARYFKVVTDAGELRFEQDGACGKLVLQGDARLMTPGVQPAVWCVLDAFILTLLRSCGMLFGPGFALLELRLQRPPPACRDEFERVLRIAPVYGCADNALVVDAAMLRQPLAYGNSELARWNEEAAGRYLASVPSSTQAPDMIGRLQLLLRERLPGGDPSQHELANSLAMSPRSLQRQLAQAGTTYRALLNDTRHALALEYLRQQRYSISEMAYLLGFAEVSAFTRAFRRWTGQSPSSWRDDARKQRV